MPQARLIRSLTRTARKRLRKLATTQKRLARISMRQLISSTRRLRRALPRAKVGYQVGSAGTKSSDVKEFWPLYDRWNETMIKEQIVADSLQVV